MIKGYQFFNKNRIWLGTICIILITFDGCFCNEKPWIASYGKKIVLPQIQNIGIIKYDWSFGPLIPYTNTSLDHKNKRVSPFGHQMVSRYFHRHWLGTDSLGRDTLAGVIKGIKLALLVGFLGSFIALFIATFMVYAIGLGSIKNRYISLPKIIISIFIINFLNFYLAFSFGGGEIWVIIVFLTSIALFISILFQNLGNHISKWQIDWDPIIIKSMELFRVLPAIMFLLIIAGYFATKNVFSLAVIIGLLIWPFYVRLLRGEMTNIINEDFIISAQQTGLSFFNIFKKHILPNIYQPIAIAVSYSLSSIVLLEATLSFLGVGLTSETTTLGQMIKLGRLNLSDWWLVTFPSLAILGLLYIFENLRKSWSK